MPATPTFVIRPARPVIAVVGAAGPMGQGFVRAALADPQRRFAVRALVRNPQGTAAHLLAALGASVVAADPADAGSLTAALAGSHGVFAAASDEPTAVHALAEAARAAGVAHVVRAAPDAAADTAFAGLATTFLRTPFVWERLLEAGVAPGADGTLELALPLGHAPLDGIAAGDIGAVALAAFARRAWLVGQSLAIGSARLTGEQIAAAIGRSIGEPVRYRATGAATSSAFAADVAATRFLHPGAQSFWNWLEANAQAFRVAQAV